MKRVIILIVAALVLAAGTGVTSYYYLQQAEDRALAQYDTVAVMQTSGAVVAGTTWADAQAQGLVRSVEVPAKFATATLLSASAAVDPGYVANRDLPANQLLGTGDFQATVSQQQLLPIPANHVALAVGMDVAARLAPFLSPGDVVALYGNDPNANGQRLIFPEITVLAIANTTVLGTSPSAEVAGGMITFAVPQDRATDFLQAVRNGGLYMAMLPNSPAVTQ